MAMKTATLTVGGSELELTSVGDGEIFVGTVSGLVPLSVDASDEAEVEFENNLLARVNKEGLVVARVETSAVRRSSSSPLGEEGFVGVGT